jgi:Domain of unknown function (DUF4845)
MSTATPSMHHSRQRGFSLFGMMFYGGLLACLFVVGAQVTPTIIEYTTIKRVTQKVAREGGSVAEIRAIFDKATSIDAISSISGKDLDISKVGDKVVVAFAYKREIHLAGPAYLVLKYEGQSK